MLSLGRRLFARRKRKTREALLTVSKLSPSVVSLCAEYLEFDVFRDISKDPGVRPLVCDLLCGREGSITLDHCNDDQRREKPLRMGDISKVFFASGMDGWGVAIGSLLDIGSYFAVTRCDRDTKAKVLVCSSLTAILYGVYRFPKRVRDAIERGATDIDHPITRKEYDEIW